MGNIINKEYEAYRAPEPIIMINTIDALKFSAINGTIATQITYVIFVSFKIHSFSNSTI